MNQGSYGLPQGNPGDLQAKKKWWIYIGNTAAVPGMPARAMNTWYLNNSDEEITVSVGVISNGSPGGVDFLVSDSPLKTTSYGTAGDPTQSVMSLGLNYANAASFYQAVPFQVPGKTWYQANSAGGAGAIYTWNEYRRRP